MKKLLALLLALVMVFGMVACGQKAEAPADGATDAPAKEDTSDKAEEKPADDAAPEEVPAWKQEHPTWLCEEKVTLKVYTYDGVNATYLPPSNDVWFWQMLEEYTNVHIEWEIVPYADYNTLIQTKMAAGGDMPDIMNVFHYQNSVDFGENGLLTDLAPYWDTCFTNTQAYFDAQGFPFKKNITATERGEIFGIPTFTPVKTSNTIALFFNKLWMEELGLEEPTSVEELTEVLRAMKAAGDLNGNGVDDEIVLTSASPVHLMTALNTAFDIDVWYDGPRFSMNDEGKVESLYVSENQKAQLAWLNQMYDEGILDAEITINNGDMVSQKIAADRVGVIGYYTSFLLSYSNLTSAGQADLTGQYYVLAQPLTSEFCDEPYTIISESYSNHTAITADCEYPEIAAKWLDTLYADPTIMTIRERGPENEAWEMVDGVPTPIKGEDGKNVSVNAYGCGQLALCWIHPQMSYTYKTTRPWFEDDYAPFSEGLWKSPSIPPAAAKNAEEIEIFNTYWTDFSSAFNEYRDKFITGELDVEADWDSYAEVLDQLGQAELAAMYESMTVRFNSMG